MHNYDFDLRRCERVQETVARMTRDLTQNRDYAETAIAVANRFFHFDYSQVFFSGFVTEQDNSSLSANDPGPLLYVEIWNKAQLCYCVGFQDTGLAGTLHVDLKQAEDLEVALGQDLIGAVVKAVNEVKGLDETFSRVVDVRVDDHMLHLSLSMRP